MEGGGGKAGSKWYKAEKYWGAFITNKNTRTSEYYAWFFSTDGSYALHMSELDFKKVFAPMCEHIYEGLSKEQEREIKDLIPRMTKEQKVKFIKELVKE